MSTASIISVIVGYGYVLYMCNGFFELDPSAKPYNSLHKTYVFLGHLIMASVLIFVGLQATGTYEARSSFGLFAPLCFLIAFLVLNTVVRILTGRHLIMADRWDTKPPEFRWYVDGIVSIMLLTISICAPIALAAILANGQ